MTARPWDAEHAVSVDEAAALIAEAWPELAGARVAPFGSGWDNSAFLVDGRWLFRFPRRAIAAPLLEREVRLLPALAPTLPLAIPVPRWIGKPARGYPWSYAGYALLDGEPAARAAPGDDTRAALAAPLGRFLAALHGFPVDEARALGAGGDTLGRTDVALRAPRIAAAAGALGAPREGCERVVAAAAQVGARPAPVLVHGDLYASHVLVDASGGARAVIDWGDVHVGDAAVDLGGALGLLPRRAWDTFCAAYGRAPDEDTLRLARFRALYHALNLTRYAVEVGDGDLEREGRRALDRALSG